MKKMIFLLSVFIRMNAYSASYDTLPKGVNTFVFKHVNATQINSKYDEAKNKSEYTIKEAFTANTLENISEVIKDYFNELKAISPESYDKFSLGEFKAEAHANVSAQGFGIGHGITNHLTIYGSIPVYHVKSNIYFKKSDPGTLNSIKSNIDVAKTNTALSTFVKNLTMQLPDANEELIQSVVVNFYGYKALGNWEKDALGDAEIGAIYRLTDFYDKGISMTLGTVLPTGDSDDPDSLQDISTGDGQTDFFIESNAGIGFFNNYLQFDLKNRYTYQIAKYKTLRTYEDSELPLSKDKEYIKEKLGDKTEHTIMMTIKPNSWFNFNTSYIYSYTAQSEYYSNSEKVNKALSANTESIATWGKIGIGFSSVDLYKAKKSEIPAEINLSAQKLLNAKNSADYERFDIDLRLYF